MCDKCRDLIACPSRQKRVFDIFEIEDGSDWAKTSIVVERNSSGQVDAFITSQVLIGVRYSNTPFDINNCPFCGENLKGEVNES